MVKNDPKIVAKGLILFKGKYLFVLRSGKEKIMPSMWDIPGGGIEAGETISEALIREIKEETGINISASKFFPVKNWGMNKNGVKIGGTDFLCILNKPQEIKLSAEHIRARWFSKKEIANNKEIPAWLKESVKLATAKLNKL